MTDGLRPKHLDARGSMAPNSRRGGGYSLRRSITEQIVAATGGMIDEILITSIVTSVHNMLSVQPNLDITRYRVSRA